MILIVRTPNIKKVEEWQLKISENVDQNVPIAEKIMLKYTGSLDNEVAKFLLDGIKNGFSAILELTPRSIPMGITVPESYHNHFNLESKAENKNGRIVVASA